MLLARALSCCGNQLLSTRLLAGKHGASQNPSPTRRPMNAPTELTMPWNIVKTDLRNVEFRLGEIEHLPVADASVDVIISNCVVNLSPDKPQVFREAMRVLKPGGRLLVSDLVLTRPLTDAMRHDVNLYVGCVAGASLEGEYLQHMRDAGFGGVEVVQRSAYTVGTSELAPGSVEREAWESVVSVKVRARKA